MKEPEFPWNPPKTYDYGLDKTGKKWNTWGTPGTERTWLHKRTYPLTDMDDVALCYECEDQGCEECDFGKHYNCGPEVNNLQDILDLLPEGVNPKEVSVSIGFDDNPPQHWLQVTYQRKLDLKVQTAAFEKARAEWDKKKAKYDEKKKKYDDWKRDKDIAEMQERLKELKSQK